jgi:hypothetical protein
MHEFLFKTRRIYGRSIAIDGADVYLVSGLLEEIIWTSNLFKPNTGV